MTRTIIHVDLDAFFCAVEELRDPALRGKAFAVGGLPGQRGVVASCSYPARARGVRSAMSMARALALCPHLVTVQTHHAAYREASHEVMARLRALTPKVEQLSIDEAFLDVTDLVGDLGEGTAREEPTARTLAVNLQAQITEELGLSCSVGIASNKMVAKIATDHGKATSKLRGSPAAICEVPFGEEAQFLAPLPVGALWGVGPKMAAHLSQLGIVAIGELAARPQQELVRRFGRHGYEMGRHARGLDLREVVTHREAKSVSTESTFPSDIYEIDTLEQVVCEQADEVAGQLAKKGLRATTVKLKLRRSDFTTPTRQMSLAAATADATSIREAALRLLHRLWHDGDSVRLVGVGASGLLAPEQLELWTEEGIVQKLAEA